ncbi:hypothetical protein WME79_08170 [Sorangium sp. So ce726]|uniref:hypothetical protein n=1 Tax=Sorangium sp. So ce726 TaxID=3133319 RepID=UPI003F628869
MNRVGAKSLFLSIATALAGYGADAIEEPAGPEIAEAQEALYGELNTSSSALAQRDVLVEAHEAGRQIAMTEEFDACLRYRRMEWCVRLPPDEGGTNGHSIETCRFYDEPTPTTVLAGTSYAEVVLVVTVPEPHAQQVRPRGRPGERGVVRGGRPSAAGHIDAQRGPRGGQRRGPRGEHAAEP